MDQEEKAILMEMFPHTPEARIDNIIHLVRENSDDGSAYQLESMINMLTGSDEDIDDDDDDWEEGAVGYANGSMRNISERYFHDLLKLFPDMDHEHLRNVVSTSNDFNELVEKCITGNYPKKPLNYMDVWEQLKSMLPGADPMYLKDQAMHLFKEPHKIEAFVQEAIENNSYPTMQDYYKHKKEKEAIDSYANFDIDEYLEIIPNPLEYFGDPDRKSSLSGDDVKDEDVNFALNFLYNHYCRLRKKDIEKMFNHYKKDLIKTSARLDRLPRAFRTPRDSIEVKDSYNVVLQQEVAYIRHKKLIKNVIKLKDQIYSETRENARAEGCLQKCGCCFDSELLPEECFFCENNCTFCKDCIRSETKVTIGKGSIHILCMNRCGSEFSLATLKMVLCKKTFDLLAQKIQIEEINNANIDGLETCPHCDFSMIPNENDKIFKCQNIECMKETCRECHHPAHIPFRCNEIEYSEDVRMRTYIENEMTRALLRECHKCKREFIKSSGCNKMTCPCGAKMCYVCGAAVQDYKHFGDDRCPLFTDNLNTFHQTRVLEGAQRAKMQLGIGNGDKVLKFDPARDIIEHFSQLPDQH